MPALLQEKRDKRVKLVTDARELVTKSEKANVALTAEEQTRFETMMKDASNMRAEIEREEALEREERDLATTQGRQTRSGEPTEKPGGENRDGKPIEVEFRGQKITLKPGSRGHARATDAYRQQFARYLQTGIHGQNLQQPEPGELRTAAAFANDIDADGGNLHAPFQFVAELIKTLDNMVYVRKYARVLPVTTTDSLGIPNMTTRPGDADWTTEVGAITADVTSQIATRQLAPKQLTKLITVSQKLLMTAAIPPEQIVNDEFASIFARTEEKAFMTGDGTTGPLGVYYASASGISTARDFVCGTSTAITFDGLIKMKYSQKAQYRNGSRWNFHRDTVLQLALLKDGVGDYLWQPSKKDGDPDMLMGIPVDETEYAPNTFTTGLYVGMLANWKYYWIADLMAFTVQRLNELLALNSKVGFLGRKFTDAAPVLEEAFVRGKLA